MSTILGYIVKMAPYMAYAIPVILAIRIFAVKRLGRHHKRTTVWHEAGVWSFLIFMAGLASITVIPRDGDGTLTGFAGLAGFGRINLVPFRIAVDSWKALAGGNGIYPLINIGGNIVMFMPVGFFVSLLWNGESLKKAALAGFIASLTVELCQLPQARGTDIDDLWLNTLGAVLGYAVFCLIRWLKPQWILLFRLREEVHGRENDSVEDSSDVKCEMEA